MEILLGGLSAEVASSIGLAGYRRDDPLCRHVEPCGVSGTTIVPRWLKVCLPYTAGDALPLPSHAFALCPIVCAVRGKLCV